MSSSEGLGETKSHEAELTMLSRYLRALAAMYIRMTFRAVEVYELLEPLLKDYRKLRIRNMGTY